MDETGPCVVGAVSTGRTTYQWKRESKVAKSTTVTLIDDVNGQVADETVNFSLDGVGYEIELTTEHAHQLRKEVMAWANAGRSVRAQDPSGPRIVRVATDQEERDAIRKWGALHGYEFLSRGRIKYHIIDAYRRRPKNER